MTDERYVAIQTERERKNVANSARKRKTHNGKSGCTLPHESMTRKELLSMNGEVQKVDLSKPMSWKEFKGLSPSLQEAYVYRLVEKYDISIAMFTKMVKISGPACTNYLKNRPQIKKLFNGSKIYDQARKRKRDEFLAWIAEDQKPVETVTEVQPNVYGVASEKPFQTYPETKKYYPTKTYTQAQVDEMLLRQKVEIYESIIDRLLDKKITLELKEVE